MDRRAFRKLAPVVALCGFVCMMPVASQESSRLNQVLDTIIANERELAVTLERYQPLVETYIQTVRPDTVLGSVPVNDNYFFGRLELAHPDAMASANDGANSSRKDKKKKKTLSLFDDFHSQTFKPERFAQMLILDRGSFDLKRILENPIEALY